MLRPSIGPSSPCPRELDPVFFVEGHGPTLGHPGPAAERARDLGASPVEIPPSDAPHHFLSARIPRTLYARSPGYAWGRIVIDVKLGGDRLLLLDPAGDLEVVLIGEVTDPGAKLRLFGQAYYPAYETVHRRGDGTRSSRRQRVLDLLVAIRRKPLDLEIGRVGSAAWMLGVPSSDGRVDPRRFGRRL